MAFTGAATVQKVTENCIRITGLSLAGAAAGTLGFNDKTVLADVSLGLLPNWEPYELEGVVSLQDAVKVSIEPADDDVVTSVPISIIKTGTTHLDFLITLHNDTAATLSPDLEIYVEFAGH